MFTSTKHKIRDYFSMTVLRLINAVDQRRTDDKTLSDDKGLVYAYVWWLRLDALQWRHNEHDGVSNHQPSDCLLNRLFRRRWKKTSKLRVIGLGEGNSPVTGEFPAQRASNAENASIWWLHHGVNKADDLQNTEVPNRVYIYSYLN